MAPEILRYEKYDAKADLWSVGAVLFEMSVGKPPFRAQNHVDLLRKIERGEDKIKFPDEKRSTTAAAPAVVVAQGGDKGEAGGGVEKVAADLKALIRRLLKRNPAERMSFEEFFLEAKWVAEGGSAAGLVSAEMISRRYNAERERVASGTSAVVVGMIERRSEEGGGGEGAFVRSPNSSTTISRSSRLASHIPVPPTPSAAPSTNPYAATETEDPPPFARQGSNRTSSSPTPSSIRRTPSFAPKYVVGRSETASGTGGAGAGEVRSRDFAEVPSARTNGNRNENGNEREGEGEMMDDDSVLGRDYVVVEKRTVEINALADGSFRSPSFPFMSWR